MSNDYQLQSWCNPYGHSQLAGLVGQIHFETGGNNLDRQDLRELNKLNGPFRFLLLGERVHFLCVGHADHRATIPYNHVLGLQRANTVKRKLDEFFSDSTNYSAVRISSRGEEDSHWPMPTQEQMAADRRVDIFANKLPMQPRHEIQLPRDHIFGRRLPEIEIREVMHANRQPTNWMPASRTSEPVATTNPPGDRTGSSRLAVLPVAQQLGNQGGVALKILEGLERIRETVAWRMMDHARGGILIVVAIDVRDFGGTTQADVRYVQDYAGGVFSEPRHAIGHWQQRPRLMMSYNPEPFGQIQYRYFWATRR